MNLIGFVSEILAENGFHVTGFADDRKYAENDEIVPILFAVDAKEHHEEYYGYYRWSPDMGKEFNVQEIIDSVKVTGSTYKETVKAWQEKGEETT